MTDIRGCHRTSRFHTTAKGALLKQDARQPRTERAQVRAASTACTGTPESGQLQRDKVEHSLIGEVCFASKGSASF